MRLLERTLKTLYIAPGLAVADGLGAGVPNPRQLRSAGRSGTSRSTGQPKRTKA